MYSFKTNTITFGVKVKSYNEIMIELTQAQTLDELNEAVNYIFTFRKCYTLVQLEYAKETHAEKAIEIINKKFKTL